ncbi:MAG TPA: branched-chain amino acid ABC transporter permease [Spirochaetes bacterium]|nr:branched-chain amino acid ABC transporter permease [Spirochaetota bacterium]
MKERENKKDIFKSSFAKSGFTFIAAIILMAALRNPYYVGILIFLGINIIITIGLSLLMGYAGQISLGQAAFFGIGAYTSGVLTVKLGMPLFVSFPLSLLMTVAIAFLVGLPTLRLKGHYLAMATLGLGEIVFIVFNELLSLTGGPSGFGNIPLIRFFGFELDNDYKYFVFVWAIVALILYFSLNLVNSRVGRALKAIHKAEKESATMGINTSRLKLYIFALSAGFASIAGFLYAHYVTFLSPGTFSLGFSIILVTMVAVGGMENIWGAIIGTTVLTVLPEYLRFFKDYDILIYGVMLMTIMLLRPEGLYGIKIPVKKLIRARN